MNSKGKFVLLLITYLLVIIGSVVIFANLLSLGNGIMAVVLIFLMIIPLAIFSSYIKKRYYDIKAGIISDDERTKKVRLLLAMPILFLYMFGFYYLRFTNI